MINTSSEELIESRINGGDNMGRIIVFTGKGGVGKTSVASSHALLAARSGKKTLLLSTDMAHNLCDIFQREIGREVVTIRENLDAVEIDPNYEMERHYGKIKQALNALLFNERFTEEKEEDYEDLMIIPGLEELFSLIKIMEMYELGKYEVIIVDCAPTGETLSLLKFPELFGWYMKKLFPLEKIALKVMRPITKHAMKLELPDDDTMNDIEKLYVKLIKLQELLKDRSVTSIRLVTIPEKMVVEETKRNYMYLNLYDFNVDALFINRIIPEEAEETFFDEWKEKQKDYITELEEVFGKMPIYYIKWYSEDINGEAAINKMNEDSFNSVDMLKVLKQSEHESFSKTENGYELLLSIPFADKKEMDLMETASELMIKVGNFKRNIPLPLTLRNYKVSQAKFEEGRLRITFEK